jgi:DNA polymerase-4
MKAACVLTPQFAARAEWRRNPSLQGRNTLVISAADSKRVIISYLPYDLPINTGMALEAARSLVKDAHLVEYDQPFYHAEFEGVLDALSQVSPDVEDGGLGLAYVGLDGLERLYGGDANTALAIQRAVPPKWEAKIGIGPGKFPAYLAALRSRHGRPVMLEERSVGPISKASVDHLPVPYKTRARLHKFGLHTLGDVSALSLAHLQAQFGKEGRLIWHLSQGQDPRPLVPRQIQEEVIESLAFPQPVSVLSTVLIGLEVLVGRAVRNPVLKQRLTRIVTLTGDAPGSAPLLRRLSFKEPTLDKGRILARIKGDLERVELVQPIESLSLTLSELTGETGRQESIFSEVRARQNIAETIRHLSVSLGRPAPIFQVREVEPWSRIPERRHVLVQFVP